VRIGAESAFCHFDLKERKISYSARHPSDAVIIGKGLFMPHLQMQVARGIAGNQAQSRVNKRLPIHAVD
jgi:hypothetical protein